MPKSLHKRIVDEILPKFAERLKAEGVISAYNHDQFVIPTGGDYPDIRIVPDIVLVTPNDQKVLIEVANPIKAKRFLGEIISPQILGHYKMIDVAILYVLGVRTQGKRHIRGMVQNTVISGICRKQIPSVMCSWSDSDETNYRNLKLMVTKKFAFLKF